MEHQMQTNASGRQPGQDGFERPRVVVRFRDGVNLDAQADIAQQIERGGIGPWGKLSADFPGIALSPVFTFLEPDALRDLVRRAMRTDQTYKGADFGAFYFADTPPGTDLIELVKTLLTWNGVDTAYIDQAAPPPFVDPWDDPRFVSQGYLDPAPDGIDAEYAWGFAGGDGARQRFVDLEMGWTLDHEDLAAHGATLLFGTNAPSFAYHGTPVLGRSARWITPSDASVSCRRWIRWGSCRIIPIRARMRSWPQSAI